MAEDRVDPESERRRGADASSIEELPADELVELAPGPVARPQPPPRAGVSATELRREPAPRSAPAKPAPVAAQAPSPPRPPPRPPSPAARPSIDAQHSLDAQRSLDDATTEAPPPMPPVPPRLLQLCESQLQRETDPQRKARLLYELGALHEARDPVQAAERYLAALQHAPEHVAAIRGARRALRALGRLDALPPLFDAEIAVTRDAAARARLLYDKARVLELELREPGRALIVDHEALALEPGSLKILKAIERGHRRDEAWPSLVRTYSALANAVADRSLFAAWTATAAHLTETRLSDPGQAAALYELALDADPHATPALAHVKRLGATQRRWQSLIAALRKEHELCRDAEARRGILGVVAQLEERRLGDLAAACRTIEEALEASPEDRALLAELARVQAAQGHAPVGPLARLAERTEDTAELVALCHRLGRLFEEELRDVERARPWYERALAADPTDRTSALALARIFESSEDWTALLRVHATRANAIATAPEQAELRHRMGELLERRLGQREDAAAQHAMALGLDPTHAEAFRALTRLLTEAGRWRELADVYERAIDRAPHDAEAIAWLFRLGAVLEDRLDDVPGALASYERILARDPASLGALHCVARAAERAGRYERVVEALRAEARLTVDAPRKHALLHGAAVMALARLGDAAGARHALLGILREAPAHRASLESLAELEAGAGHWDALIAVHERLLPLLPTIAEQVRLLHRTGELRATRLGDDAAAIASYRRALELDADFEPARAALLAALGRERDHAALASALEERLARLSAPAERARAATELGVLYEEELGDRARALASYEKAIEASPLHRAALDARERLLTDARSTERLARALEHEAAASLDGYDRVQAALRAALVLSEQHGVAALAAFRPVFTARPDHLGALLAVEDAYRRAGDDAGLAATYERMFATVSDPKAKRAALGELASARAATRGDVADVYRRILALAPDDASTLEALLAWAVESGDRDTERAMHARLAALARDPSAGAYHHGRIGELLLAAGDAPGALAAFRDALAADPQSVGATDGLSRAARAAGDPAAMQQAAGYEQHVNQDPAAAVALLLDAARICYAVQAESDAAAAYEEALSISPDDPEAATGLMMTMMRTDLIPRLTVRLARAAHSATDPHRAAILHRSVALLSAELLRDLPAAVAATHRALAARPEHPHTLASLAGYLERNGQWVEAVDTLERVIERTDGAALVDAHLRLASIAAQHLREPARAMRSLRIVLGREGGHAGALTALVRLERLTGNDEEALRLARQLLSVVAGDVERAAALAEIAELEKGRGHLDEAANAAYWAMGVQGPAGSAARFYRDLVASAPQHASWDHYVTGLLAYIERSKTRPGDLPGAYRELARVFERADRPERSVEALREGARACPDDAAISLALVTALVRARADVEALSELRRLLEVDVQEVGAWRMLSGVLARMGVPDGLSSALAPLVVLNQASAEEDQQVRARPARTAAAPAMILAGSGLKQLSSTPALDESPSLFIPAIGEILAKLEGFDHERWGVSKRDRIRPGDPHPLRALADRIGRMFGGVPEYDLYASVSSINRPYVIAGSPPVLLLPPGIERTREAAQAFHLARPLALLSRQLHPLDHVDDATMERILIGVVRQFQPGFVLDPVFDEEDLEEEAKRVARAIGFFSRGRLQEAVTVFAAAAPSSYFAWAREIRRLAARAALLVSDDLVATLEALREPLGPDNYASDLARFWVSDPAMRFRRAVAQQP